MEITLILICIVILLVLLSKITSFISATEFKFTQLRWQIDELAKAQKSAATNQVEPPTEEVETESPISLQPTEEIVAEQPMTPQPMEEFVAEVPVTTLPIEEAVTKMPLMSQPTEIPENAADLLSAQQPEEITQETPAKLEQPAARRKPINYEKFIGENLFGKIGILIFVIGIGFFVKYAIDQNWINETFRTILGFVIGSVLLATAGKLQKKYRTFSSLLAGGAFAVFYLTVAIAFHYYQLFSQSTAFALLIGITIFMSTLAVLYDRRELAITSLVGGFLAPFIISTGSGNYLILFSYITILNTGMFGLSFYKKWRELPMIAFVFTYVILGFFVAKDSGNALNNPLVSSHMLLFSALSYFLFLLPIISILRMEAKQMSSVLLAIVVANNFLYLLFGTLFLTGMALPFQATGLLSLSIALINLALIMGLRKRGKDCKRLIYTLLGLVLTFVSLTIPIQLDGNYITLFWASEMVLLLWLYLKSHIKIYEYATLALIVLTLLSFGMDVTQVSFDSTQPIFLNSTFATFLFVGLSAGAFAWLLKRHQLFFSTTSLLSYTPWNAIMLLICTATLYFTFMLEFDIHFQGTVRSSLELLFSSVTIGIICRAYSKRFPIEQYTIPYVLSIGVNVLIYAIYIESCSWQELTIAPNLMLWLTGASVIANGVDVAKRYYAVVGVKTGFTVYLNILATLLWLAVVRLFLLQWAVTDFSAAFSIALSIAGFVQMSLGMRMHQKTVRIISLGTFGIVLLKLVLIDLWAMPTIGKILVFIMLGMILLILSFLYQKLKDVLFKDDEDENQ